MVAHADGPVTQVGGKADLHSVRAKRHAHRPAATRTRVGLDATGDQSRRLPLASPDTDTPIAVAYPHRLWKRGSFSVAGPFGGTALVAASVGASLFLTGNPSRPRGFEYRERRDGCTLIAVFESRRK